MKKKYIVGAAIALAALATAFLALDTKQIEYGTFARAQQTDRLVQVRGTWVRNMPSQFNDHTFTFYMRDDSARVTQVVYNGGKPNNFEISPEIVCKGRMENGVFHANDILTKCPSKYQGTADQVKSSGY